MNVAQFLFKAARNFGGRPALARGTTPIATYEEFARRAAVLAGNLRAKFGLEAGDRVALAMSNDPEFMVVLFACWQAGLVAVPMNAKLHRREFEYILGNSGARMCFATPDLAETVGGLEGEAESLERVVATGTRDYARLLAGKAAPMAEVAPEDAAWLFYTSGTTGRPKGAVLTHRSLVAMSMNYFGDVDSISERDCIIHAAPMSHGSGLYGLPHVGKAANHVIPESGGFEADEIVSLVRAHAGSTFFFAPTMVTRLLGSPALAGADMSNLKTVVYGGGPMYVEDLRRALDRLGPKLVHIYGQGEAPMTITYLSKAMHTESDHPRYLERLASVGVARTDLEVRVFDEDGGELPAGEVGEVVCRGDVVMAGYWNNPEATEKTLRGGWLHTGDLGVFDEDGFLTLKDRSKDMIISGGTNIYPREVEEVLLKHPDVLEVSVVGKAHPDWGEAVVAFVVPRPGARPGEADLDKLCLETIARFKRPKEYRYVEALPKNNYGKVLKTELRERLQREAEEERKHA